MPTCSRPTRRCTPAAAAPTGALAGRTGRLPGQQVPVSHGDDVDVLPVSVTSRRTVPRPTDEGFLVTCREGPR